MNSNKNSQYCLKSYQKTICIKQQQLKYNKVSTFNIYSNFKSIVSMGLILQSLKNKNLLILAVAGSHKNKFLLSTLVHKKFVSIYITNIIKMENYSFRGNFDAFT